MNVKCEKIQKCKSKITAKMEDKIAPEKKQCPRLGVG